MYYTCIYLFIHESHSVTVLATSSSLPSSLYTSCSLSFSIPRCLGRFSNRRLRQNLWKCFTISFLCYYKCTSLSPALSKCLATLCSLTLPMCVCVCVCFGFFSCCCSTLFAAFICHSLCVGWRLRPSTSSRCVWICHYSSSLPAPPPDYPTLPLLGYSTAFPYSLPAARNNNKSSRTGSGSGCGSNNVDA